MNSKHPMDPIERERRQSLESLRRSAEQREAELRDEPEKLFSLLALDTPNTDELNQFDRSLEAALDQADRAAADVPAGSFGPDGAEIAATANWGKNFLGWAVAAALAGIAAVAVWSQLGGESTNSDMLADGAGVSQPSQVEGVAPDRGISSVEAIPASKRSIELLDESNDAQLMDLTVGDMQIVMIFDEDLDL